MTEFDNYIDSFVSTFDLTLLQKIINCLKFMRFKKCTIIDRITYRIPKYYEMIDLLDMEQFCMYTGHKMDNQELEETKNWIQKGLTGLEELDYILLLFKSQQNLLFLDDIIQINTFQEKLEYVHLIFKNLNDIASQKREYMNCKKDNKITIKMPNIPFYLLNLLELYTEQVEFDYITISELAIFLADIIQFNFPLVATEKKSIDTILQASQNKKYPLMTRKHLSYRFFYFLSSLPSLNIFINKEHVLEETFVNKTTINSLAM